MYLSFFGFKEFPFNLTPDPRFLFMSRSHREAFDHLLFGIHQRHGFIEVVGGIGTGKTTLCRALLEELDGKVATALILNTFISELELLRTINEEFEIDSSGDTRKKLIDALNRFLVDQLAQGENACLIIDECQNLAVPVLEQIRMLSNLETENEKLLQIVMVGQPEFHEMLKSAQLKQLDERINVRSFLEPLNAEDSRTYITHRLAVAGARGDICFTDGAMRHIFEYSRGNPRRINTICDRCLLIAYTRETFRISDEHARQAVAEIQGTPWTFSVDGQVKSTRRWPTVLWGLLVLLGLLGIVGGWLIGQTLIEGSLQSYKMLSLSSSEGDGASSLQTRAELDESSKTSGATRSPPRFLSGLTNTSPPPLGHRLEAGDMIAGMEVTRLTVSWEELMRFKRPCLLEFVSMDDSSPRYVLLRGISNQGVWIQEGESGLRLVPQEELGRSWFGAVWIFLPIDSLVKGMKDETDGDAVLRLQKELSRLGYWDGAPTGKFDLRTRRAVMAFQRDVHLDANGEVSPQTRALMHQLLGDEESDL